MGNLFDNLCNRPRVLGLLAIAIIQIIAFGYYLYFYFHNGYLPSPFMYDKSDTFMDLFHSIYWADNDGRYTDWKSVYPPLVFLFLKLIRSVFIGDYGFYDAFEMRDHSGLIAIFLVLCFMAIPAFVLSKPQWKDFSFLEKILIYVAVVISVPMLFALERGNVIIFCLIFLALAFEPNSSARVISIPVLINIKPYFALLLLNLVVKRMWRELAISIALSGGLFVVLGVLLDANFMQFFNNLLGFSKSENLFSMREVMAMPSSVSAFSYILSSGAVADMLGGDFYFNSISTLIEGVKWSIVVATFYLILKYGKSKGDFQLAVLVVLISNLGLWVGGYSLILYLPIVPIILRQSNFRFVYLSIIVLMVLPTDLLVIVNESIGSQFSYLSHSRVGVEWSLGVGSLIRPLLNLLLLGLMCVDLIGGLKLRVGKLNLSSFANGTVLKVML